MEKKTKKIKSKKKTKSLKSLKSLKKIKHKISLKLAKREDFLELEKYEGKKKVWKMIEGFPYWLINSKGEIENKNYILDKYTNLQEFSNYLTREQVLILTN